MSSEYLEPPVTGHEGVDEALRKVAGLPDKPLAEHVQILREAHDALQSLLNSRADAS